jgi:LysM repeat protein
MFLYDIINEDTRRDFLRKLGVGGAAVATGTAFAKNTPKKILSTLFVGPGDTIYSIARNFGIRPEEIYQANPGMNRNTRLEVNQEIKVPDYATNDVTARAKAPAHQTAPTHPKDPVTKHTGANNALQEPDFIPKLKQVANALGVSPNALAGIIRHETNNTFSPKAKAPGRHGAVGLIQFIPKTARQLGTSTEALEKMSGTQQLDYVYKFYKTVGVRPGMDIGDLYMLTFMPAYAHKSPDTVLGKKGGGQLPHTDQNMHKIWAQNPAFSKDHSKSYFTIQDVKDRLAKFLS